MKHGRIGILFLFLFGISGVLRVMSNPRIELIHGSDIVSIMAVGMCFGAALVLTIFAFRKQ